MPLLAAASQQGAPERQLTRRCCPSEGEAAGRRCGRHTPLHGKKGEGMPLIASNSSLHRQLANKHGHVAPVCPMAHVRSALGSHGISHSALGPALACSIAEEHSACSRCNCQAAGRSGVRLGAGGREAQLAKPLEEEAQVLARLRLHHFGRLHGCTGPTGRQAEARSKRGWRRQQQWRQHKQLWPRLAGSPQGHCK